MVAGRGLPGGIGSWVTGLLMESFGVLLLGPGAGSSSAGAEGALAHGFVLCLLPLFLGAGLLLFDRRSRRGRWLTYGGAALVVLGLLSRPRADFEPTLLVDTLLGLSVLGAGVVLVTRPLRLQRPPA